MFNKAHNPYILSEQSCTVHTHTKTKNEGRKNVEEIVQENTEEGLGVFWSWQGKTIVGKIETVTKFKFVHANGTVTEITSNNTVSLNDWE